MTTDNKDSTCHSHLRISTQKKTICRFFVIFVTIIFQAHKEVGMIRKAFWCLKEWQHNWHSQVYEVVMLLLVFIVPLCIMGFAYISISREMWRITTSRVALRAAK